MHGRYEKCMQQFCRKSRRKEHVEELGLGGRIILECILGKQGREVLSGCIWPRTGISGGSFEHGSENSGSSKGRKLMTSCVTTSFSSRTLPVVTVLCCVRRPLLTQLLTNPVTEITNALHQVTFVCSL
jgi:hypothetical protein